MMKRTALLLITGLIMAVWACSPGDKKPNSDQQGGVEPVYSREVMKKKVQEFKTVTLQPNVSHLSKDQRKMLEKLIEVARIMDDIFWKQSYGDKDKLMKQVNDKTVKQFININYGPWERLNGNKPFLKGVAPKPEGARFYPDDMTKEEFQSFKAEGKTSLYTLVRRNKEGELYTIPYREAYNKQHQKAARLLREAAELAESDGFKKYLNLRAKALLTDEYYESDVAWMEMKDNAIDFVVGPIENYEDGLFNYKAAHEAFILIKDQDWSKKLNHYASLLPDLQNALPVNEKYKAEEPGRDSDLGAYEVMYYAGDCNAGSKTIAINLPNDPKVRANKGSRKLQLKNAIKAKFDKILMPIGNLLIAKDQRKHLSFDAFFENTMFHEVAHGLGIDQTINGKGSVREALKEHYSAIEESKADIVGLFVVTRLNEMGEFENKDLMDNYVTFMASIFRSIRFGVASSHGKANMIRFNYFKDKGAFTKDEATNTYKVDFDKMKQAMLDLSGKILTIQGNGNYQEAKRMVEEMGIIKEELQNDLKRIEKEGIPRDIRFKQGKEFL